MTSFESFEIIVRQKAPEVSEKFMKGPLKSRKGPARLGHALNVHN